MSFIFYCNFKHLFIEVIKFIAFGKTCRRNFFANIEYNRKELSKRLHVFTSISTFAFFANVLFKMRM